MYVNVYSIVLLRTIYDLRSRSNISKFSDACIASFLIVTALQKRRSFQGTDGSPVPNMILQVNGFKTPHLLFSCQDQRFVGFHHTHHYIYDRLRYVNLLT